MNGPEHCYWCPFAGCSGCADQRIELEGQTSIYDHMENR